MTEFVPEPTISTCLNFFDGECILHRKGKMRFLLQVARNLRYTLKERGGVVPFKYEGGPIRYDGQPGFNVRCTARNSKA